MIVRIDIMLVDHHTTHDCINWYCFSLQHEYLGMEGFGVKFKWSRIESKVQFKLTIFLEISDSSFVLIRIICLSWRNNGCHLFNVMPFLFRIVKWVIWDWSKLYCGKASYVPTSGSLGKPILINSCRGWQTWCHFATN